MCNVPAFPRHWTRAAQYKQYPVVWALKHSTSVFMVSVHGWVATRFQYQLQLGGKEQDNHDAHVSDRDIEEPDALCAQENKVPIRLCYDSRETRSAPSS